MTTNTIQCPKCGTSISLNEALSSDIKEQYRKEFQEITAKREAEIAKLQQILTKEKEAIETQQAEIDKTVQSRLVLEKTGLEKKMREEIQNSSRLELDDLKAQISEKAKRIEEAEKNELSLRKKTRELEEKERSLEVELQRKFDSEKVKIQDEITQKLAEQVRLKTAEKDKQLEEIKQQNAELKKVQEVASKREVEISKLQLSLSKEKEAIASQIAEIDKTVQSRLVLEKTELEKKMREDIQNSTRLEVDDLKAQISEKAKRIEEAEKNELNLRKKTRELEDKEKSLEVELQRRFDEEKTKIEQATTQKLTEEIRLKTAEKDKQLDDMRRQIEDLKRKAEQGSQQSQGEILELEIELALKTTFPIDQIDPVQKGMKGGDIVHKVITSSGQHAGTIIWETKRTKSWSDGWIDKLKDDQRAISAEFAVIITQVLPKDVSHLAHVDGVWVVDFMTFRGIAVALRSNLLQLFQTRAVAAGKGEKMDFLYSYLTGTQFKQRIETIVESFRTMQNDLDKEKRVIQKGWAAREQQLVRVLTSTVGMYGDIQGIVGASLPKIASLELETPDSNDGNNT